MPTLWGHVALSADISGWPGGRGATGTYWVKASDTKHRIMCKTAPTPKNDPIQVSTVLKKVSVDEYLGFTLKRHTPEF